MFLEVWNYVRPVCESTAVEIVCYITMSIPPQTWCWVCNESSTSRLSRIYQSRLLAKAPMEGISYKVQTSL